MWYTDLVSNLTLSIDGEVLRRARIRALQQGTSVNAVVRDFIEAYAGADEAHALERFIEISDEFDTGTDNIDRSWDRKEIYGDRTRWPHS